MQLILANKAYSSWSMRPWLLMRTFDLAFDERLFPLDEPGAAAEIRAINPAGKVPILIDGEIKVWDSLAIVEYLAEAYPTIQVWPRDPGARAMARSISAEMHSGYLALRRHLPMNMRRAPRPADLDAASATAVALDVARIEQAWTGARALFGAEGPFLFGAFSAADAMFAPVVNRFHAYAVPVSEVTRVYMTVMMAQPAWRDWQREADAEGWRLERIEAA